MPGQDIGSNDKRKADDGGGEGGRRAGEGGIRVTTEGLFMVLGEGRDIEGGVKILELDDDTARRERRRTYVLVLLIAVVVTVVVAVGVVGGVVGRDHREAKR